MRYVHERCYYCFPIALGPTTPDVQTCAKCDKSKPLSEFRMARSGTLTYRRSECNDCLKAYWSHRSKAKKLEAACQPAQRMCDAGLAALKTHRLGRS